MRHWRLLLAGALMVASANARAEFILNQAIVEFNNTTGAQQDIEIISRSETSTDYIVTELYELQDAGLPSEQRMLMDDPAQSGLLVTPDKAVLAPGGRQVLRFVLVDPLNDRERIFRVAVKPVVNGLSSTAMMGLKVLVGYEVLVIVRPSVIVPKFSVTRHGRRLTLANRGNSNVMLEPAQQCSGADGRNCQQTAPARIYPMQQAVVELPFDAPLAVTVWDGKQMQERVLP